MSFVIPWLASACCMAQPNKTPIATPSTAPSTAMITDSHRIIERTWRRLIPTARSSPSSRVRSKIDRPRVFTMPNNAMRIARPSSAETSARSWSMNPAC